MMEIEVKNCQLPKQKSEGLDAVGQPLECLCTIRVAVNFSS